MTDIRSRKPIFIARASLILLSVWVLACLSNPLLAQFNSDDNEKATTQAQSSSNTSLADQRNVQSADDPKLDVELGFSGFWKLGYPTQAVVSVCAGSEPIVSARVELEAVDADGVGVICQADCQIDASQKQTLVLTTQHGRAARSMQVRLLDSQGRRIVERSLYENEQGTVLPVEQPWVVGIGSDMMLDQVAMRSTKSLLPSYSSCEISDTSKLPRTARAYEGVDLLVLSTRDWSKLEKLSSEQQQAILDWVQGGGHALIWIGENAQRIGEQDWVAKLIRAEVKGIIKRVDPVLLESYLSSQKRLDPFTCSHLIPNQCIIDLSLNSRDRQKLPLIYRSAFGFGQVQVFAADLDSSPLLEWSERKLLLERLYQDHVNPNRLTATKSNDQSRFVGYDDLSGQVHAALDLFTNVRLGSLSLMATILFAIGALLGPFDYFIISKSWRRPTWTWISLLLWSLSTMITIAWLAKAWKPEGLAVNSIELVDVDYSTLSMRGRAFAHCYAGQAGRYDIAASARDIFPIQPDQKESTASRVVENNSKATKPTRLSWSGQPGAGLGGFESDVRTDIGFPAYRVINSLSNIDDVQHTEAHSTDLVDVGINFAGTKSIRADWTDRVAFSMDDTNFKVPSNSEFLQGKWTNPMDCDLMDGWLLFRSWLYPLPSRVRAQGFHQIAPSDIPKDLGRRLQRRQILQERDTSLPWNPTDRKDIGRLVEMLTLYQAAGGAGYTGLTHRYWHDLDLSEHLKMNRAIVFGRLAEPLMDWSAKSNTQPMEMQDGNRSAYVRFVIPVTIEN